METTTEDFWTTTALDFGTTTYNDSFNISNNATKRRYIRATWSAQFTCISVLFVALAIWIIVANSMIVAAPIIFRPLRRKTYIFVSSLGVADLLTAITIPLAWFLSSLDNMAWEHYLHIRRGYFSNFYCQVIQFCNVFPLCASLFNLLLIAIDRYIGIAHPLKYPVILTVNRSKLMLILMWLLAFALALPNFFWNRKYKKGKLRCFVLDMAPGYAHMLGGVYWLLTLTMFVLYLRLYLIVRKQLNRADLRASRSSSGKTSASDRNAAIMLFITLGVFVVCWTPLVLSLHIFVTYRQPILAIQITHILAYLNSGMNFFIYVVRNKKYKAAFKQLCPICFRPALRSRMMSYTRSRSSDSGGTDSVFISRFPMTQRTSTERSHNGSIEGYRI